MDLFSSPIEKVEQAVLGSDGHVVGVAAPLEDDGAVSVNLRSKLEDLLSSGHEIRL